MNKKTPQKTTPSRRSSAVKYLILTPLSIIASIIAAWTFGALYFDGPASTPGGWNLVLAVVWLISVIIIASKAGFGFLWQARLILCCLPIYVYWLSIRVCVPL